MECKFLLVSLILGFCKSQACSVSELRSTSFVCPVEPENESVQQPQIIETIEVLELERNSTENATQFDNVVLQSTNSTNESPQTNSTRSNSTAKDTGTRGFNYASFDCGAVVRSSNKEAENPTAILLNAKDAYMLNQCAVDKYVEIELCEDIKVQSLTLANFEYFSSMFKDFVVYGSSVYPPKWIKLGTFQASNSRTRQNFDIIDPAIWTRYLKIELLSHYGHEFYCPLTSLQVFGTTMLDEAKVYEEAEKLSFVDQTTEMTIDGLYPVSTLPTCIANDNSDDEFITETKDSNSRDSVFAKITQRLGNLERFVARNEKYNNQNHRNIRKLENDVQKSMIEISKLIDYAFQELGKKEEIVESKLDEVKDIVDTLQSQTSATARRAAFEKRAAENRKRIEARQDLMKSIQKDNLLMANTSSSLRIEHMRRMRQQGIEEIEKETLMSYLESQEKAAQIQENMAREEEIIRQMQMEHQRALREQKLRQSIKENSNELRELGKKLNYAYMNKERYLQIKEKELMKKRIEAEDDALLAERNAQEELSQLKEQEQLQKLHQRAVEYHQALYSQIEENERKKKEEYDIFLKEKEMIDEIVQKINLENERDEKLRFEKQQETKAFIEQFMKDREIWKEQEQQLQEAENKKIEEYAKMQKEREEGESNRKKMIAAGKDERYDKLAAEIESKERLKEELENLRIELAQEEQESLARKKDRELMEQRIRKRLDTINAYHAQISDKRLRQQEEKEKEEAFRKKLMEKFAEDDRIEQMKQSARRMKQLEHRRAVDALIEERRRLQREKEEEDKKFAEAEKEMAYYRAQVIEQERQRLLHEHAARLKGFLPKGVLRDKKDLEIFDQEFEQKFGSS